MSANQSKKPPVPQQQKGAKSDTSHSVDLNTPDEAKAFFIVAKNRLMDVSNWHKLCGLLTATFSLMDSAGNQVYRPAEKGDYLRIDIPGPNSDAGDGYDWVRLEAIENKNNAADDYEEVFIRARPAKNPNDSGQETAHFFQQEASTTFMVVREKNVVKAEIHGRNELPNVQQETKLDTLRNAVMALGAMLGFSKFQWKKISERISSAKGQA